MYSKGMPFPCSLVANSGALITIGDESILAGCSIHAEKRIDIGKRVLIGAGTRIMDNNGHNVDHIPHFGGRPHREAPEPIEIEDDVWLSTNVVVLKGVHIGRGSVIGANSVVTSDVPPMVVAAGAPAKVIRSLRINPKKPQ